MERISKFGKKMPNGQIFIKTAELKEILGVNEIVIGFHGIFIRE